MKQCTPPASLGNLFVIGFRPMAADLCPGRLRQIGNMSVLVCLYTEQACFSSPSRHSGSSSAFKYRLRPLHWHDTFVTSVRFGNSHSIPLVFLGELFDRMMVSGCQCPPCSKFSSCPVPRLWHAGVKPIKAITTEASF